jgi:hypothetical protein
MTLGSQRASKATAKERDMALKFATKKKPPADAGTPGPAKPVLLEPGKSKPAKGLGWLKKGKAAHQAFELEEAKAEKARAESSKLFRFFMPPEEERRITFLDGELDDEGMLDIPMFYQHRLKLNGQWQNFVCVSEEEPCPICEKGDNRAGLVGVMTVLDHTPYKIKNGPNAGKLIKNSKKLFVATRQTIKKLSKKAAKHDGLTGCTFEVSRTGDKDPAVGSDFDFVEQLDAELLVQKYGLKAEDILPGDYREEITYHTAAQMIALGIGKAVHGIGHEKGVDASELEDEL